MRTRATEPLWKQLRKQRLSADALLEFFDIDEPYVDVEELAVDMGVLVERTKKTSDWSGALDSREDPPVIWVKHSDAPVRQRFTIAHEIGHLMLHPLGVLYRDVTFAGNRDEVAANAYAARLLMPAKMVRDLIDEGLVGVPQLARRFRVSQTAMEYRLDNLGYRVG